MDDTASTEMAHITSLACSTPASPSNISNDSSARRRLGAPIIRQLAFLGPGLVAAIAYIDPGNWSTDLAAGASYGYSQLFVVLFACSAACVFQILAARLGIVTQLDLAQHCRAAFYNRPSHTRSCRYLVLWPLYLMSELSMIFTDLGELTGCAIALNLLAPRIPLWAGILIVSSDIVLVLLIFYNYPPKTASRSVRGFEMLLGILLLGIFGCIIALLSRLNPQWGQVFLKMLPNADFAKNGGLYAASGIIGATIAPNALYLGSRVAIVERSKSRIEPLDKKVASGNESYAMAHPDEGFGVEERAEGTATNILPRQVQSNIFHATVDIFISLMATAFIINVAIVTFAAAAASSGTFVSSDGDLYGAYTLIYTQLGAGTFAISPALNGDPFLYISRSAAATLFAIGVFASGEAAGLVVTLSGQVVAEGYLHWKVKPWMRRLATRAISIMPALVTSVAVGRSGLSSLLVIAQVANSLTLPFIICPLLCFTADPQIMTLKNGGSIAPRRGIKLLPSILTRPIRKPLADGTNYATPAAWDILAWALIALLTVCNLYGLVQVGTSGLAVST